MNTNQRILAGRMQDPRFCLESPMERVVYNEFKTFGLVPKMQYQVGKYFLDFAFPEALIGVEYDGEVYKKTFLRDMRRDEDLQFMGWDIYRLTKDDLRFAINHQTGEWEQVRLKMFMQNLRGILENFIRKSSGFMSIADVMFEQLSSGGIGSVKLLQG